MAPVPSGKPKTDPPRTDPPKTEPPKAVRSRKTRARTKGDLAHMIHTGLPPGIDAAEVKDPGSQLEGTTTDNRS
jgi:hypothetical protein